MDRVTQDCITQVFFPIIFSLMTYPPQITFCKLDLNQRRLQLFQRSIGTCSIYCMCNTHTVNCVCIVNWSIFQLMSHSSLCLSSLRPSCLSYFQHVSFYLIPTSLCPYIAFCFIACVFLLQLMSLQLRLLLNSEVLQIQIYPIQITGSMAKKLTPRCPGQP